MEITPGITDHIGRLVIMGGALGVPGTVPPAMSAEWNMWVDPHAANAVLASGIPITIVPLNATNHVPATRFFFEALEPLRDSPAADLVYRFFEANPFNLEGGAYFFWDPLAAITLIEPDVVRTETKLVSVLETEGEEGVLVETEAGVSVEVALEADGTLLRPHS